LVQNSSQAEHKDAGCWREKREALQQDAAATGRSDSERTMYELDHAKDQVMTVLKLALANVVMWALLMSNFGAWD